LHCQFDALDKTIVEKRTVVFSKVAEHPEIGAVHLGDIQERQIFAAAPFDFPRTKHTTAVGINEDRDD